MANAPGGVFLAKADVVTPDGILRGLRSADEAALGIDRALLRAALPALGMPPDSALRPHGNAGTFHRIYAVGDGARLMRVASLAGEPWCGVMVMEAALAQLLRGRGLAVPHCEAATVAGRGVQRLDHIEGETASARDGDDEALTVRRLQSVARFLRSVHELRGEGFGPITSVRPLRGACRTWRDYVETRLDAHLEGCVAGGALDAHEASESRRHIEHALAHAAEPALLHGDPGGNNFIVRGDTVAAAIDWEDALLGDPIFEVASMCTFQPERRHAAILEAYGVGLQPGSPAWRRFWSYFLRVSAAKTVHRQRFGYVDAPGRTPAAARLRLALARLEA